MPTEADQSFADSVIRLRLVDESRVQECLKTVAEEGAPSLSQVMIERGLISREAAERVLAEEAASPAPEASQAPDHADSGAYPPDEAPAIPGYEVLDKLGAGGMGTVWKARQTSLDRLVAIKVLPPVLLANEKFISRFRREALATARLNDPHIVSAIDVGVARSPSGSEIHYFVMEYVDGESVEDILRRSGKLSPERAVEIVTAVARALDHAWSHAGIVHRDIKPGNILVSRTAGVKLADMGLARSAWEDASLTATGLAIGTPHYASPEQAQGKAAIDTRSDIYGLGATMFRMLTGRTPFEGTGAAEVMAKHVNEDAPDLRSVEPTVPAALAAMVRRMMQRDPAARYQTAGDLLADLERWTRGDRPLAFTQQLAAQERAPSAVSSRPPEVFQARPRPDATTPDGQRHWPHALGALLLLAAVGAGLAYLVEHSPRSSPPPVYNNRVALWFSVSNPSSSVGAGGDFPRGFNAASRVRYHIQPSEPAYVYVMMATAPAQGRPVTLTLLAPDTAHPVPRHSDAFRAYPGDDADYAIPSDAATVVLLAAAGRDALAREELVRKLHTVSKALSRAGGLGPGVPEGQTLWYGHRPGGWSRGSGTPVAGPTGAALDDLVKRLQTAFAGGLSFTAAATTTGSEP